MVGAEPDPSSSAPEGASNLQIQRRSAIDADTSLAVPSDLKLAYSYDYTLFSAISEVQTRL